MLLFCSIACLYLLCRVPAQHFPRKSGGAFLFCYIFARTTPVPGTWLMAYCVYCACRIQQCVYVVHIKPFSYSLSTSSSRVRFGSCSEYYFFGFIHFVSFFPFFSHSMYLGCWRVYVVLVVPTQYDGMALRCLICLQVRHEHALLLCRSL